MTEPNHTEKQSWFEQPKNINLMIIGLVATHFTTNIIMPPLKPKRFSAIKLG